MRLKNILCGLMLILALSACSKAQVTPVVSGPMVTAPRSGTASVTGRVLSSKTGKPLADYAVRLAEVFYDEGVPFYLLDAAFSPGTVADADGYFVFTDVEPKEYILGVGDYSTQWKTFEENGESKIYKLVPDQILDVGVIKIDLGN
jgi:hypothetical protein